MKFYYSYPEEEYFSVPVCIAARRGHPQQA